MFVDTRCMPIRLLHIWRLLRQGDEKEWADDFGMDDASKGHARASIDPRLVDRSRRRGVRPSGFVAANQGALVLIYVARTKR